MAKFIILIGRKYFSIYVAQNKYWLTIQNKLLTALFLKNIWGGSKWHLNNGITSYR